MKLYEFFGSQKIETDHQDDELAGKEDKEKLSDDIYWFILDNDDYHKKFFLPLAREIKKAQDTNAFDQQKYIEKFMPLVKTACIDFYKLQNLTGHPKHVFSKSFRIGLSQRLATQYFDDISRGEYSLGE